MEQQKKYRKLQELYDERLKLGGPDREVGLYDAWDIYMPECETRGLLMLLGKARYEADGPLPERDGECHCTCSHCVCYLEKRRTKEGYEAIIDSLKRELAKRPHLVGKTKAERRKIRQEKAKKK